MDEVDREAEDLLVGDVQLIQDMILDVIQAVDLVVVAVEAINF